MKVSNVNSHHNYDKVPIGGSDSATLKFVSGSKTALISYGGDGDYFAYIVDENCIVPAYYHKVYETSHSLSIYDDDGKTLEIKLSYADDKIICYRAGEQGTIIQVIRQNETGGDMLCYMHGQIQYLIYPGTKRTVSGLNVTSQY